MKKKKTLGFEKIDGTGEKINVQEKPKRKIRKKKITMMKVREEKMEKNSCNNIKKRKVQKNY